MKNFNTKICKHCGKAEGYYIRIRYSGVGQYYFYDDGETEKGTDEYGRSIMIDNSDFYNGANWKEYKTKYCASCSKRVS